MATIRLLKGDCLQKLKELEDNSVDSIVTDPPYGLGFMGKDWDTFDKSQFGIQGEEGENDLKNKKNFKILPRYNTDGLYQFSKDWAIECYRVLKPGGHLLSFAGSRTYHKICMGVEDAGFEIRDQIMWIYGSGFPKSHNIGKAVDKLEGNEREVIGTNPNHRESDALYELGFQGGKGDGTITKGNSEWEGWGTALKPAHEPIVMARKPFKGTVADNVLEWGTGGINVDGCRIGYVSDYDKKHQEDIRKGTGTFFGGNGDSKCEQVDMQGRFPANIMFECTCENPKVVADKYDIRTYNDYKNTFQSYEENDKEKGKYEIKDVETTKVIHTDPNCPCYILDQQSGVTKSSKRGAHNNKKTQHTNTYTPPQAMYSDDNTYGDTGGASRFFYCPKASKKDRNDGCDTIQPKSIKGRDEGQDKTSIAYKARPTERQNIHPTVKPTDLMAYLVRLVTPKGGVVLDPFMGSGSTGKAAVREGMNFIGIERETEYMEIAKTRIEYEQKKNKHTKFFDI
jgi:DNA modification methylase